MLSLLAVPSLSQLQCKNPSNGNTDWFAAFKVPTLSDRIPTHTTGLGYFYHDNLITLSEGPSDLGSTTNNPLYNSMKPLYSKDSSIGYLLVSDQPPNGTVPSSRAHMKGILIFDKDNGIYIEHSSPNFPPDPKLGKDFSFPKTSTKYGQSFLCLTMTHEGIETFAQALLVDRPGFYSYNFPSYTATDMPSLQEVVNENWNRAETTFHKQVSIGKSTFDIFGKSPTWGKDLYHDLLAPTFKSDIYSETWCNGVGTMDAYCDGDYHAMNILNVDFDGVSWARNKDHSKWALAGNNVFIGGINRQNSQTRRGGGGFSINDAKFAAAIKKVITSAQSCSA